LKRGVDEVDLSRDGRWLAFVSNEAGISVLRVLDTKSNHEVAVPRLPVGVMPSLRWRDNSRELAFSLSTASQPFDVYSVDVASDKVERISSGMTGASFDSAHCVSEFAWDIINTSL
jgi:Tol biopolymer transport system component